MIHYEETRWGFDYGSAKVTRITSDEKKGWVVIGISTRKKRNNSIQIYVTKTGKIRVHSPGGLEWSPL